MTPATPKAKEARNSAVASRRGRPSANRVAEIDAAIRDAALSLFLEVGYEAGNMDVIAANAGVSKGTLYSRYDSKELLFRTVLEDELNRWSKRAGSHDNLLPETLVGRLRHHALILVGILQWPQYHRVNRLVGSAILSFPNIARLWKKKGTDRYLADLVHDMASATDVRDVPNSVLELHANLFLYGISGWYQMEAISRPVPDEEISAFIDQAVSIIRNSICNTQQASGRMQPL